MPKAPGLVQSNEETKQQREDLLKLHRCDRQNFDILGRW